MNQKRVELPFKPYKTLTGKLRLKYQCPGCKSVLESELSEAGTADLCPTCNAQFTVPGTELASKVAQQEQQKAEAAAAATLQKELAAELEAKQKAELAKQQELRSEQKVQESGSWEQQPANCRYPQLKSYVRALRFVAWLLVLAPIALSIAGVIAGIVIGDMASIGSSIVLGFAGLLVCVPIAIVLLLIAESVQLMLDLREDVAKIVVQRKG